MYLDWPNLLAGAVIGFFVGVFANYTYGRIRMKSANAELKRRFAHIPGDYVAFLLPDSPDIIDYANPVGNVSITYERDNILLLRYAEIKDDNVWEAVVWMETPSFGSLAWRYVRLQGREPVSEHRCGFKRCVVSERIGRNGESRLYFYLVGENPFGKEVLEKGEALGATNARVRRAN
jgi:hypothetical protein